MTAELVLEDDVLRARGMAHERRVPPADVTAVRPMGFAPSMVVIDVRHRCPILTVATKGLCRYTAEMERRRPGLPVRFGWPARLGEQLPGRSRTTGD